MKYTKLITLLLLLLQVFVCLSDLCSAQTRFIVNQNKSREIVDEAMKNAFSKIGVEENPPNSNSGGDVNMFLMSTDLSEGNQWCVAFCQWAYRKAAHKLNVNFNLVKSGHSITVLNYAKRICVSKSHNVHYGDWVIFGQTYGTGGHCALLVKKFEDSIITIDGNTGNHEKNNGGVFLKKRNLNNFGWMKIKGFVGFGE